MDITQSEYLALVIKFEELLGKTILKKEYFEGKNKILFEIIKDEYDKNKTLSYGNLCKYKKFDQDYYIKITTDGSLDVVKSLKDKRFKVLEQSIIEEYKDKQLQKLIKSYNGNQESFYKTIDELKKINAMENEYIKVEDMLKTLEEEQSQIKLGFNELDKTLNISENDFVVIAGGTGTGKTTFALNLLSNLSKEYQCIYFNMEMSKKVLYRRLTTIETGIDITKLNNIKTLTPEEMKHTYSKLSELTKRKIILINKSQNLDDIEKVITRIDTDKKIIVFIDHIGLIKSKGNSLYEKMTETAKKVRGLCLDYNCTIFGLCQLSRESQKDEKEPKLQDLRDSGEIEQSARKVILLYNKDINNKNEIKDVELLIAKNDAGTRLKTKFKFDTKKQKFMEVENGK